MRLLIAMYVLVHLCTFALAHDSWINKGGYRGPINGEWCCGEGDCFIVPKQMMKTDGAGYVIKYEGSGPAFNEHVPWAEVQPSPDGEFWRCKRPDGSRRCFFAPPPAM